MCYFCTTLRFNIPQNVARRQKFLIVKKEEVSKPPFSFGTLLTPSPFIPIKVEYCPNRGWIQVFY